MDWIGEHLWAVWLGLALVLLVAEMLSLDFVLLMLATGAASAAVLAGLDAPVALQVVAAVGVSVGMVGFVRPSVVKRLHNGPELRLGPAAMIGKTARVTKPIAVDAPGTVVVHGEIWSALPLDERETMDVGDVVDIYEVRGATLHVVRRTNPGELPGLD